MKELRTDLGDASSGRVRREHADEDGGQTGETQRPQDVAQVGDDVAAGTVVRETQNAGPSQPLNDREP